MRNLRKVITFVMIILVLIIPGTPLSSTQMPALDKKTPAEEPEIEWQTFTVTGYTLRFEECGKRPGHPLYGITYSGVKAKVGVTAAGGPELPIGTVVIIPELAWFNGTGEFIIQDRGGKVGRNCIDIYFGDPETDPGCVQRALTFGRKQLKGMVLEDRKPESKE